MDDVQAVVRANEAFYAAFEGRDIDAMSAVWEHSDRVLCTHPGWGRLHGWGAVAASWYSLFTNPQRLQFIVTDVRAEVSGDVGWVACDENLLDNDLSGTVAALNVFTRHADGAWRLVAHHASPVAGS